MKRAGEDREIANEEFQKTTADLCATQTIKRLSVDMAESFLHAVEMLNGSLEDEDKNSQKNNGDNNNSIDAPSEHRTL